VRALVTTIPQYGHLRPLVPLVEALEDAGHEVAVATASSFGGVVAAMGLKHVPAGVAWDEAIQRALARHPDVATAFDEERSRRVIPDFFVGICAAALLDDADRLLEWRPDVVIREEGEFAGPVLAALAGVPCVDHGWGPMRPREQVEAATRALAPIWERAGLEPSASGGAYEWLYLDPCPPSLQFAHADEVASRHPIRPVTPRRSTDEPPAWLRELGDRVVYVTLGTVAAFTADTEFLRAATEAARDEDVEVVVTVGPHGDPAALGEQPANVHVERFVPQSEVLAHCVAAVTNGGSGSMLGALSAGVPLLLVPGTLAPSQVRNAHAVMQAGAGRTLPRTDASRQRLHGELRQLLGDASYRNAAQRIAAEIAAMPSPAQAVELIERLAETRAPAGRT
jgi:UDP:flavonoid glycosyltransferase YjiC (YdhE family)